MREKVPALGEIAGVFAAASFIVYSWTMYESFWKVPSWLFFLEWGEIVSLYSYAFLVNFLESVALLGFALTFSVILPRSWWKDAFVARGAALTVVVVASAQLHLSRYPAFDRDAFLEGQLVWWFHTLWIAALLVWAAGRIRWVRNLLESIADRLTVFLYVFLPLTAVGAVIVAVRILG